MVLVTLLALTVGLTGARAWDGVHPSARSAAMAGSDGDGTTWLLLPRLRQEDLPPGFQPIGMWPVDDRADATGPGALHGSPSPAALAAWGFEVGALAAFRASPPLDAAPELASGAVDRFRDAAGAARAFAEWPVFPGATAQDLAQDPLAPPALPGVDEVALARVHATDHWYDATVYFLAFRVGRYNAAVIAGSMRPGIDDGGAEAIRLAGILAERIRAEAAPPP